MEGFTPYPKELADEYILKGIWWGMTIIDLLDRATATHPEGEALVEENARLTYAQLNERVNRLALAFLELGIQKGDSVVIQLPNQAEFAYTYLALQKIGAITVMAIPRHGLKEIDFFLQLSRAVAWVVPTKLRKIDYSEMMRVIRFKFPYLKVIVVGEPVPRGAFSFEKIMDEVQEEKYPPQYLEKFKPDPDDVTHLMPTGGTTGLPKLVPRTHNSYICNARFYAETIRLSPSTIDLVVIPLGHNAGLLHFVSGILAGGKIVLCPSTRPEDILRYIEQERATWIGTVPTILIDLLRAPGLERRALSSLEFIQCGAAHVPAELAKEVLDRVGCKFVNAFGMAEGLLTRTRLGDSREVATGTVGTPQCPYDEFKIIDDEREVPQGQEGELACRGPGIFTGYYKAKKTNRKVFTQDGFFHTGDLAKFDSQGHIIITGRKKDIIIRGGENISATEVEELIVSHPDIIEAAVVGMPDARLGEKVCAYIKAAEGKSISLEEVVTFLKQQGASVLLLPERIESVSELPLTLVGKINKNVLRADIARKLEDENKAN